MQETWVRSLSQEDPLENEIATHSSILTCEIPRTEEPGRLQSTELQRVRYNSVSEHAHTQIVVETYKVHKSAKGVRKLLKTLQWKKYYSSQGKYICYNPVKVSVNQ